MFTTKYHQLIFHPHPILKLWVNSLVIGGLTFALILWYLGFSSGGSNPLRLANQAAAETSIILICLSMAMSGIVYFWDFADHYLLYRKYIGLVGFYFALYHGLYTLNRMILPYNTSLERFFSWPTLGLTGNNLLAFIFALISLLILVIMAVISNAWATNLLGGQIWRHLLRTGYIVLLLGGLHSGLKTYEDWLAWFQTLDPIFPPLSLITTILIISTFALRLMLQISLWRKTQTPTSSPT